MSRKSLAAGTGAIEALIVAIVGTLWYVTMGEEKEMGLCLLTNYHCISVFIPHFFCKGNFPNCLARAKLFSWCGLETSFFSLLHTRENMAKKGGGSQLTQLKSRLHNDGITDRRQMKSSAKKRKRGQAASEREDLQARRDQLQSITSSTQFNPFEQKVTKPKNAVLGRKVRGATGKPGAAKMGGLQERTARLLPEWVNRNKSGSFVDKRFGENDNSTLSMEEKMLERFTREQQHRTKSRGKASLFNLDDAEEEGLTHYGQSLNDMDDFDDIRLSDEEENLPEGKLRRPILFARR